jgi:hypothetical protein
MDFTFELGVPVLERTPAVVRDLLVDLPPAWVEAREGPDTWSPFDVVGHLIHGERTDWVPRVEHLLEHGDAVPFPVFDRFAMFEASRGKTLAELLGTFAQLRAASLDRLKHLGLGTADLARRGRHPELGVITLGQHLATWVAHDLCHIAQIARVMGRQYREAVGPWTAYLPMLGVP